MTAAFQAIVLCDACGEVFREYDGSATANARDLAKAAGWTVRVPDEKIPDLPRYTRDYCPRHLPLIRPVDDFYASETYTRLVDADADPSDIARARAAWGQS